MSYVVKKGRKSVTNDFGVIRYYKGKGECVVEVRSKDGKKARIRFLEDFEKWKRGDRVTTLSRLCWKIPKRKR